ncbi:UNVERIFIED_CONTAM: hypothetical protein HDU68_007056, partial [Siphonaria sp. JEL0065]
MHHHCGTPVEGEELPGQSVWCKNCAPRIVSSAPLNPGESRASTKVSKQEKSAPKKNATTSDARKLAAAKKSKPTSTSLHPSSTASTASTTQKSAAKTSAAEVPAAEVSAAATLSAEPPTPPIAKALESSTAIQTKVTADEQRLRIIGEVALEKRATRPESTTKTYAPKQKQFNIWRKSRGFSDENIDDGMILLYLREEIVGKPQKKRGRRKKETEGRSEEEEEEEEEEGGNRPV